MDTAGIHRVCVAYLDCRKIPKSAANFLVLWQNRLQSVFEFSVFDLDAMLKKTRRPHWSANAPRITLSTEESAQLSPLGNGRHEIEKYLTRAQTAIAVASRYIAREVDLQGLETTIIPQKWVVFTETRFKDQFYSDSASGVTVIGVGDWKRSMAPPSALEFILAMAQSACADFFLDVPSSHYFSKGCLFDYNDEIKDGRLMVLVSDICASCRSLAESKGRAEQLSAMLTLVDRGWIGDVSKADTVAAVLKKTFGFDLYVSRGLAPSRWETLSNAFMSGLVTHAASGVAFAVVLIVGYIWARIGFPWLIHR